MSRQHERLAELILYISDRSEMDEAFDSPRLAKALFYADFLHYLGAGRSITGERYVRVRNGPAPGSFLETRGRLEAAGDLIVEERLVLDGHTRKRPIAVRRADLSAFTADEILTVDYVIAQLQGRSATDAASLGHRFEAWKFAAEGEEIPYETALLSERRPTAADLGYAASWRAALPDVGS